MKRAGLLCAAASLICTGILVCSALHAEQGIGIIGGADYPTFIFCLRGILHTPFGMAAAILAVLLLICGAVLVLLGMRKKH